VATRGILWADFRLRPDQSDLCGSLPQAYRAQRVTLPDELREALQQCLPKAVCFEYDHPNARRLNALEEVRNRFRSLPVVVVAEPDSRALARCASRWSVWDYLVKPILLRRLCHCLASIDLAAPRQSTSEAAAGMPLPGLPSASSSGARLAPAVSYVQVNYAEKLRMETAARLCDLSPCQFSRSFKKENGLAFRDFVVRTRIERAAELMKQSRLSVTEAAFFVGFNDLSYFARMFRRQLGVSPSHYRHEHAAEQLSLFAGAPAGTNPAQQNTGRPQESPSIEDRLRASIRGTRNFPHI
jgi:two-component system, response regulator YesN